MISVSFLCLNEFVSVMLIKKGVHLMSLKYELDRLPINAKEWYYIKTDIRGNELQSLGYHSSSISTLNIDEENDTLRILTVEGSTHIIPISRIVRVEYK